MKYFLILLISGILLFPELAVNSYSQSKQKQTGQENFKNPSIKKSPDKSLEQIGGSKLKKTVLKNQSSRNDLLFEDFESGNFPPTDWQNPGAGNVLWNNYNVSANGVGNYCAFYEFYGCELDNDDYLISPVFNQTDGSQYLVFDYAYAPAAENWFDNIEIFYSTDGGNNYSSLVIYSGLELQTAPYSKGPYEPQSSEWRTKYILLPAGTNVITFNSLNACANNFYMDNVRVGDYVPQYALNEDFESGNFPPGNWSVEDTDGWYNVNYTSGYGNGQYSSIFDFYFCGHSDGTMTSPVFSATPYGSYLYFDYAYAPRFDGWEDLFDDLEIFISTDDGNSYQSFEYITGEQLQTAPSPPDAFVPDNNQWATYSKLLPPGVNRIRFKAINDCGNNLFIDNIKVDGVPTPVTDIAVKQVYAKGRLPRTFITNDTISAVITNEGNQDITDLKVYLNITGANSLLDTVTLSSLPQQSSAIVKFKPFNPTVNGNSLVKVRISHGDENPDNDSALYNTNVNSNYFAYTDTTTNTFNGAIGSFDAFYVLQKFRVSNPNSRITEVRVRIPYNFGDSPTGQIIKGVIADITGTVKAKSDAYRIKASDHGTFVSLKITDPIPYYPVTAETEFYIAAEFSEPVGREEIFAMATNQDEDPPRPGAYYWGFGGITPVGGTIGGFFEAGGKYGLEAQIISMPATDVGIASQGNLFDQYYNSTVVAQTGKVFNNALSGTANATVIRRITPGAYTSSVPVSIPANSSVNVTFANFTFTSGTAYTVRDSIVLTGDVNLTNNVMTGSYTPRIAKDLVLLYQKSEDRDSLIRSILADGRYANNFDSININYTGSYRPWKIMFNCPKSQRDLLPRVRDSLKSFLDASTPANKKTLVVFGDRYGKGADPSSNEFNGLVSDSIFLRQYLKTRYVGENWLANISASGRKFKGKSFFDGITQDSVGDPLFTTACLIKPVNGGAAAFVPSSVTGSGSDSAVAVSFSSANFNTFFMSNRFSDLRSTNSSPSLSMGPVRVYTKIIDWIQGVNLNVKVLDLTAQIEGYYDFNSNSMYPDTMRVYLRSSINPYPKIDSAKALLNAAGQASFVFSNASNGVGYYIQLKHRNGLETWSKTPQSFSSNHMAYNFTSDSAKAFGNNMKKSGSKWLIFTGDADQNSFVDLTDVINIYNNASAFVSGYVNTDVNGNSSVDLTDVILAYNNSSAFVKKMTPLPQPQFNPENRITADNVIQSVYENKMFNEDKIDHDIYDRFKDQKTDLKQDPDIVIYDKGKSKSIIKGKNKIGIR